MNSVEDPILFKNVETITLKRDRLLRRLRKRVEDFTKGRASYDDIEGIIKEIGRLRRALIRAISNSSIGNISREFKEPISTLLEFSLLVSIEDEEELLNKLRESVKDRVEDRARRFSEMLNNELSSLTRLRLEIRNFLSGT